MHDEEAEGATGIDYATAIIATILAVWAVYTTFLIMGALLGSVVENGQIRFAVALVLAAGAPALTAAGVSARKQEGFGVERVSRFAFGTFVISLGAAAIVSVTMADKVIPTLSRDSNWFVENRDATTGFPETNRRYSQRLSRVVCSTADAAGFYYCPSTDRM